MVISDVRHIRVLANHKSIQVGELDAFRDEDLEYARNLGKAGVPCEFHLTPGAPHAYEGLAPEAEISRATIEARLRVIKNL